MAAETRSESFRIDVPVIYSHLSLPARLTVVPMVASLEIMRGFGLGLGGKRIVHRDAEVLVIRPRLIAPLSGPLIELRDNSTGECGYVWPYWGRSRSIRAALVDAGFRVHEQRAWIFVGFFGPWRRRRADRPGASLP
jgi:hypothetical protein